MLQRKAFEQLLRWREKDSETALFVTGARQIGKSYLIEHLAATQYKHHVTINLLQNREAKEALTGVKTPEDLIRRVSLFSRTKLVPGETLIFIDEVQELPDLLTMAKFLVQDGRYAYAFSGSMLGTELKGVRSWPVGYVTEVRMYPLDFFEFCQGLGVSQDAFDQLQEACATLTPLPAAVHEHFLAYFRTYVTVGGMPAVVQSFLENESDLGHVRRVQTNLSNAYVADITKYAGTLAPNVRDIYEQLPLQLDSKSGRFRLNTLSSNARYEKYRLDFNWLVSAGVALKCNIVRDPKHPLGLTQDAGTFKLYQSDTGMLVSRYGAAMARDIYLDAQSPNVGCVYENVFAQELAAREVPLHYYLNKKRGEIDFICENTRGCVLPLEIKSGRAPRAHASLSKLLEDRAKEIPRGYVFSRLNFEQNGPVTYLPWYATVYLEQLLGIESPYNVDPVPLKLELPPL